MAVQALGLPLLLQANDQQLQDLLSGLKVGDSLKGRIVELLSPEKAVVGLRGQNVIAQLPHSDFQKGEILSLQVFQNQPAEAGQAASLTLKLLPPQPAPSQSAWPVSMPNLDQAPMPSAAALEAALTAAQLPQNSLTLSVAQTLASLGVPLEAPALTQAVQAAQSLLNAETALFTPQPAPSQQAQVEFQAAVRSALDQLQVAGQTLPQGEGALALNQASRHLQSVLPAAPAFASPASVVAQPVFDQQGNILPTAPAPILSNPAAVAPQALPPLALSQWSSAFEAFVSQPTLQGLEGLKQALVDLAPQPPLQAAELIQGKVQAPSPSPAQAPTAAPLSPLALPAIAPFNALPTTAAPAAPLAPAALPIDAPSNVLPAAVAATPAPAAPAAGLPFTPAAAFIPSAAAAPATPAAPAPAVVAAAAPSAVPASAPAQAAAPLAMVQSLAPQAPAPSAVKNEAQPKEALPANAPIAPLAAGLELGPLPAKVLIQRETLALLGPALREDSYSPAAFSKALQTLALALEQPQSPASQALLSSVLTQAPALAPAVVLQEAKALVQDLGQRWSPAVQAAPERPAAFAAAPASLPAPAAAAPEAPAAATAALPPAAAAAPSATSLPLSVPGNHQAARSLLQRLGLPVPRQALSEFAPATVGEAVAWLQARELPAQRPLVEAVAVWLATGEAVLPKAEAALMGAQDLPERIFNANPGLRQAVDNAVSAYQASALRPDDPQFTQKLIDWVHSTGLNLEFKAAAQISPDSGQAMPAVPAAQMLESGHGLRPALLKMERALRTAQAHMEGLQDLPAVQALDRAIAPAQQAIQALQALPLQAQSVPGFDTIHLPLPVWMAGQVGDGRLSVSWRQGRDRELSEKDPVNVAVSLKTEGLGEVKVLLQVWKGSAQARVLAADQATADFLSQGAEDLKGAFNERTPFALQSLDFSVAEKGAQSPAGSLAPAATGLSLSA